MRPTPFCSSDPEDALEHLQPCAGCGRISRALLRGMCVACRGREEDCLRWARAFLAPGQDPWRSEARGPTALREPIPADPLADVTLPSQEEAGFDLAACELCEAPTALGYYCARCQTRVSAAVAIYEGEASRGRWRP